MSDQDNKGPAPESATGDPNNVEVEELDDKSLEDASGGIEDSGQEFAAGDSNGFMCNC